MCPTKINDFTVSTAINANSLIKVHTNIDIIIMVFDQHKIGTFFFNENDYRVKHSNRPMFNTYTLISTHLSPY